jgi:hypothetical protein
MIQTTSIKTGKESLLTEEQWQRLIELGLSKRYVMKVVPGKKFVTVPPIEKPVVIVPKEIKTKTKKNG